MRPDLAVPRISSLLHGALVVGARCEMAGGAEIFINKVVLCRSSSQGSNCYFSSLSSWKRVWNRAIGFSSEVHYGGTVFIIILHGPMAAPPASSNHDGCIFLSSAIEGTPRQCPQFGA
jgi:hypothetical protein